MSDNIESKIIKIWEDVVIIDDGDGHLAIKRRSIDWIRRSDNKGYHDDMPWYQIAMGAAGAGIIYISYYEADFGESAEEVAQRDWTQLANWWAE